MPTLTLPNRIRIFRSSFGISQSTFAKKIGVSKVTVIRWENGSAKPSPLAAKRIQSMGLGPIHPDETNLVETPAIKLRENRRSYGANGKSNGLQIEEPLENRFRINRKGQPHFLTPAPYVPNGPSNQMPFFRRLIQIQDATDGDQITDWSRRLSAVEKVENTETQSAQFVLENPKETAAHWNPNYGSHGWHRYIGRFPPHRVRALLNSFNASSKTTICDPFAGSGTSLVECRLLGIPSVGIEICPLSALISKVKSCFPSKTPELQLMVEDYNKFFTKKWASFTRGREADQIPHTDLYARQGNTVELFPNCARWLTGRAFLGISITLEYARNLEGYLQDALLIALSAKMRSIGNMDVDVARAEYSKIPRVNVEVNKSVTTALHKMVRDINASVSSHKGIIGTAQSVRIINDDVLHVNLPPASIDHIITSPPYGVEASSYLRTHLLSYRCLKPFLKEDPYGFGDRVIGSEYVSETEITKPNHAVSQISPTFASFFEKCLNNDLPEKIIRRAHMMMKFFEDMDKLVQKMNLWLKPKGRIAFVIGNKRIGDHLVPTNTIMREIFSSHGFALTEEIAHKLKCNNSNSQVPWQERIIQDEFVLLLSKK